MLGEDEHAGLSDSSSYIVFYWAKVMQKSFIKSSHDVRPAELFSISSLFSWAGELEVWTLEWDALNSDHICLGVSWKGACLLNMWYRTDVQLSHLTFHRLLETCGGDDEKYNLQRLLWVIISLLTTGWICCFVSEGGTYRSKQAAWENFRSM